MAPNALEPTGKERFTLLRDVGRIKATIFSVVLIWTKQPKATVPEHYDWANDLRRGRTNVIGSLFRLFDLMARRSEGDRERRAVAREDALTVIESCREYVDVKLPAPKPVIPMHYGTPLRERPMDQERRA